MLNYIVSEISNNHNLVNICSDIILMVLRDICLLEKIFMTYQIYCYYSHCYYYYYHYYYHYYLNLS